MNESDECDRNDGITKGVTALRERFLRGKLSGLSEVETSGGRSGDAGDTAN